MSSNPIEETAPWWFMPSIILTPFSIMLLGAFTEIFYFSLLGAGILGFVCGAGITLSTIFKNKTGSNISEPAEFDALWYVFIVQRRSRRKQ